MQIEVNVSDREIVKLFERANEYPKFLQETVQRLAEKLREFAVERTPIGEKYVKGIGWSKSGHMKESWSSVTQDGDTFSFQNTVPYASIVDRGGYPGISPRHNPPKTAYGPDGKIYSSQAIGGIIRPIIDGTAGNNISVKAALDFVLANIKGLIK